MMNQKIKYKIMETLEKKHVNYIYNDVELAKEVNLIVEKIKHWIKNNDYQISGNIDQYFDIDKYSDMRYISMNQTKKINKYIFYLNNKLSLKRVNSFFCLLSRLLKLERVYVKTSLKEQTIQETRKKMKIAKESYEKLLKEYKEEKGNFYKNKIIF